MECLGLPKENCNQPSKYRFYLRTNLISSTRKIYFIGFGAFFFLNITIQMGKSFFFFRSKQQMLIKNDCIKQLTPYTYSEKFKINNHNPHQIPLNPLKPHWQQKKTSIYGFQQNKQ